MKTFFKKKRTTTEENTANIVNVNNTNSMTKNTEIPHVFGNIPDSVISASEQHNNKLHSQEQFKVTR